MSERRLILRVYDCQRMSSTFALGDRVRRLLATLSVLFVVIAAGANSASPTEPPLRTAFERSGASRWTGLHDEGTFLQALSRAASAVQLSVIGLSVEGRPLRAIHVGSSSRNATVVLFTCTQHGDEPAPREACLQAARDLALGTTARDMEVRDELSVFVVPTVNPDGVAATERLSAAGIDINRDHIQLQTPEAYAIQRLVNTISPNVIVDLHEFYGPNPEGSEPFGGAAPVVYDDDSLILWPRNLNVDPQIYRQSRDLVAHVASGIIEGGYTVDEYGQYSVDEHDVVQIAGDGDEGILRNAGALRHAAAVLMESNQEPNLGRDVQEGVSVERLRLRRVRSHRLAITAALDFALARGKDLRKATSGARARSIVGGANQSVPVYFGGADNEDLEPGAVQDPPPCAYEAKAADMAMISDRLAVLSIATTSLSGTTTASMAQPARPLIPLVLDPRGARSALGATAVYRC